MDLYTIITCRTFCDRLRKMGQIAREEWLEAALAVYSSPDKPRQFEISEVLVNDDFTVRNIADIYEPYSSIDTSPLVYEDDMETVRRDLLLDLHSHPLHHESDHWHISVPSMVDISLAYERACLRPHLVSAVTTFNHRHRNKAHLFLFAASPVLGVIPYFEQFEDEDLSRGRTIDILDKSNVPYVELTLNTKSRAITTEAKANLDEFAAKIA